MKKINLHDQFVAELNHKFPKKADLVNLISDILKLEREPVYRRIAGKVNFSVQEIGILSVELNISLDSLLYGKEETQWIPLTLKTPLKFQSMDHLCDMIDRNLQLIKDINREDTGEAGRILSTLPLGFYISSPMIMKFMFFKWGHYFIRSEEYNLFSEWKIPDRVSAITAKYKDAFHFNKIFYIWDASLIMLLCREITNFHQMHIITTDEKNEIRNELKGILLKLERYLNGTYTPGIHRTPEMSFYISSTNLGFESHYYTSGNKFQAVLQTYFSFSVINNSKENFERAKEWIKSFQSISTLLSRCGRKERRLFFETQNKIVDRLLCVS